MTARWLIVLTAAVALVGIPVTVRAWPAAPSTIAATELAARVQGSASVGWSGLVESTGTLQVPDNDSFANLAQLLGERNELRVWWREPQDWRIDRIRGTGETDLYRRGTSSIRWVFESETATLTPVSKIRLPDASDLLPPTLARIMLQGVRGEELSRLPSRRYAGVDAAGLRLTPADPAATVAHVDLWADPQSGLPLAVELYADGDTRPVLSTTVTELDLRRPASELTRFVPDGDVEFRYDQSVDVAAAANAGAPFDLPKTLAGLPSRNGEDPGAVGVYGRGPTTLVALPLRGSVAGPLRDRLRSSAGAEDTVVGTRATVGPIGLLVTSYRGRGGAFLLAGMVDAATLERAASELTAFT